MDNITLNPGGIIGGLVGCGLGLGAGYLMFGFANDGKGLASLAVPGVLVGAFAGNWLWGMVFPPKPDADRHKDRWK
ncbi:hypothetical protein OT109_04625 [Phycisphaeraceae bacterium D3-23]